MKSNHRAAVFAAAGLIMLYLAGYGLVRSKCNDFAFSPVRYAHVPAVMGVKGKVLGQIFYPLFKTEQVLGERRFLLLE